MFKSFCVRVKGKYVPVWRFSFPDGFISHSLLPLLNCFILLSSTLFLLEKHSTRVFRQRTLTYFLRRYITVWLDHLLSFFGLGCFAYDQWTTVFLVWLNLMLNPKFHWLRQIMTTLWEFHWWFWIFFWMQLPKIKTNSWIYSTESKASFTDKEFFSFGNGI